MKKNKKIILISAVLLLAFMFVGLPFIKNLISKNEIIASGTIQGREIIITSQVSGQVKEIIKEEGDSISEDQLILSIDDNDYQLNYSKVEAALKSAQARLQEALKGTAYEELQKTMTVISQAEANTNVLNLKKDKMKQDYQNMEILFESGGISKNELEKMQLEINILEEQIVGSKKQEEGAYWQLKTMQKGAKDETIQSLEAQLQGVKADLLLAENKMNQTKITSPIKGRINGIFTDKGEFVMPGNPILSVLDSEDLWIKIYIPETEIGRVFIGQEALITVDSFSDKNFPGKVIYIADQAQFTPKNVQTKDQRTSTVFPVKIKIENNFEELKPGLTAEIKLLPQEKKDE